MLAVGIAIAALILVAGAFAVAIFRSIVHELEDEIEER